MQALIILRIKRNETFNEKNNYITNSILLALFILFVRMYLFNSYITKNMTLSATICACISIAKYRLLKIWKKI
jgi:hypothetical protein